MRWVFFSLLVLNVVYFLWKLVVAVAVAPVPSRVDHGNALAPERLVLLSEVAQVPAGSGSGTAAVPALCPAVGPWESSLMADASLRKLASKGYKGELRPVRVMKDRLFWVYLPPYGERAQALAVLRELQARDVDSFVVSEGDDRNAISLGYFSSGESARGLSVKMQNVGYPAAVRETAREVTEYWLVFRPAGIPDKGAALQALQGSASSLSTEQVACQRVDTLRREAESFLNMPAPDPDSGEEPASAD